MPVVPCSPAAPVTGVVVFDVSLFKAANPEFTTVAPARLQQNFSYATLLLNNSCGSLMVDAPTRETFLKSTHGASNRTVRRSQRPTAGGRRRARFGRNRG
jgi:hypothetical protein